MNPLLILSTAPSKEVASMLAKTLVERQLAACVSIQEGVTSFFQWEGKVAQENEVLLLIKTKQSLFEPLKSTLCDLHPYEVPEMIALDISQGHLPYLHWIDSVTKEPV